jgi:hypothetical protein
MYFRLKLHWGLRPSHQAQLPDTLEFRTKKQPHLYVRYHRYLWLRLNDIRIQMSALDDEAKLPVVTLVHCCSSVEAKG